MGHQCKSPSPSNLPISPPSKHTLRSHPKAYCGLGIPYRKDNRRVLKRLGYKFFILNGHSASTYFYFSLPPASTAVHPKCTWPTFNDTGAHHFGLYPIFFEHSRGVTKFRASPNPSTYTSENNTYHNAERSHRYRPNRRPRPPPHIYYFFLDPNAVPLYRSSSHPVKHSRQLFAPCYPIPSFLPFQLVCLIQASYVTVITAAPTSNMQHYHSQGLGKRSTALNFSRRTRLPR